jgi:hypothetical protein
MLELLKKDLKPRDIMTFQAFENAITTVMATGGSTNAVLHFLAMARTAGAQLAATRAPTPARCLAWPVGLRDAGACAVGQSGPAPRCCGPAARGGEAPPPGSASACLAPASHRRCIAAR